MKMSWEDFCQRAKKFYGSRVYDDYIIFDEWLKFCKNGSVYSEGDDCWVERYIMDYKQMLMIMRGLE